MRIDPDPIDMTSELCSLVLVDSVAYVGIRTLNGDLALPCGQD